MSKNNDINFEDIYLEQILHEIKQSFLKKINADDDEFQDISGDSFEKVDKQMRKVLEEMLLPVCDRKSLSTINFVNNNFFSLQNSDNQEARKKLRISLVLYYAALHFDNVGILMQLIKEGVNFGNDPDNLLLCVLDKNVSDLFDKSMYADVIKRGGCFFKSCYESISSESLSKKKAYLEKFARIISKREDLVFGEVRSPRVHSLLIDRPHTIEDDYGSDWQIFTKEKLDIFDEETYMKASLDQIRVVIANIKNFKNPENISRLNNLMQHRNYCNLAIKHGEVFFDVLSDDEVINLTEEGAKNFSKYSTISDANLVLRVKNLYDMRPGLADYKIIFNKVFLSRYSDEEILSFPDSLLEGFSCGSDARLFSDHMTSADELAIKHLIETYFDNDEEVLLPDNDLPTNDLSDNDLPNKKIGAKQKIRALLGMK